MKLLKKINDWIHLWMGLASGVIVFIVSLTGCVLVFQEEIEDLTQPYRFAESPTNAVLLPPSRLREVAEKALPGKTLYNIRYNGPGRSVNLYAKSDSLIFINPYTAQVSALIDHDDFFHFMEEGHTHLWLPVEIGREVVSYGTLVFAVLLLTGLVLWWPKKWNRTAIRKGFRVKWSGKFKRVNYDLHNVWGFYSLIPAFVMALTGIVMGIGWFSGSVYWLTSGGKSLPSYTTPLSDTTKIQAGGLMGQVDKIWYKSVNELATNKSTDISISFPQKPSDPISVYTNTESYRYQGHYFDQHTLRKIPVLSTDSDPFAEASFADKLKRMNYTLHLGMFGGLFIKTVYFLASLVCASLPVTGFLVWWGKRRKKNKVRKQPHMKQPRAIKNDLASEV